MSSTGEQIVHDVVDREEPLSVCHRFEAPHVALAATVDWWEASTRLLA
jgi:hypothetical protein